MPMLAELQARFQSAVRDETDPGPLLRGNPHGLRAYRIAYPARLVEALQDNYSALHQALGDAPFTALGHAYLRANPPTEPSLRAFGHQLPAFMDAWPDLPHPALADLARLDWALRHAFDAQALPALHHHQLTDAAQWAHLPLQLQAHVRLVPLQWAVGPAWHALQAAREAGEEAPLPPPAMLAHTLLTWRIGLSPQWRSLDTGEAQALAGLHGQPAAAWADAQGEAGLPQAVAWLQRWVQEGLLIGPP